MAAKPVLSLLFDFDGLILETEEPVYRSWVELYAAYACDLPLDEWVKIIGTSDHLDLLEELERQCGLAVDRELVDKRRQRELDLVYAQPIRPGVVDLLDAARGRGLKLAVVSSSSRAWVGGHLERLHLSPYFDLLRTRDDVKVTKPAPDLYLSTLQALGVPAEQAIVFEDSPNGIRAARAAGIFCVAVPNVMTRNLPLGEANLQLASLAELKLDELLALKAKMDVPGRA